MTTQRNENYGNQMMKAYQNKYGKVPTVPKSPLITKGVQKVGAPKASQLGAIARFKKL